MLCLYIESIVINNGYTAPYFKIERGIRQGCPLSAYLFILAIELLALKIRSDNEIKGINVNNTEIKISQLADDATCFILDNYSLKKG